MIAPDQLSTGHTLEVCKHTLYSIDFTVSFLGKTNIMGTDDNIAHDVKEIVGNEDPFLHVWSFSDENYVQDK